MLYPTGPIPLTPTGPGANTVYPTGALYPPTRATPGPYAPVSPAEIGEPPLTITLPTLPVPGP